jgi:hypothetical protein
MNDKQRILQRLAEGWRPLFIQLGSTSRKLERAGLIRVDYGPDDTPDQNRLCAYITERGKAELAKP